MISPGFYKDYAFRPVELPTQRLREHSYTILDTEEGQVFLHINHYGEKSKYGNIYISVTTTSATTIIYP